MAAPPSHTHLFRVRYSETDQMGSFYNSRLLEWMEVGRSELSRSLGLPYSVWEERGAFLPLVEAHLRYAGRARYDDLLAITTSVELMGRIRLRFTATVKHVEGGRLVAEGYTVHAVVDRQGRLCRLPAWVLECIQT